MQPLSDLFGGARGSGGKTLVLVFPPAAFRRFRRAKAASLLGLRIASRKMLELGIDGVRNAVPVTAFFFISCNIHLIQR